MKVKEKILLLLILFSITSGIYSCADKRPSSRIEGSPLLEATHSNEQTLNETRFKQWLKDTLAVLKSQRKGEFNRKIKVSDDSLSMDIKNSYNLRINPSYDGKNKELLYALDLLDRNGLIPKGEFNLVFDIVCYYSIPTVEQISYEFDSEIFKFEVDNDNQITKYNFLKGNLIDKTTTFKK